AAALGRLIDGLTALAAKGNATAETVALPLVRAAAAVAAGEWAEAIRHLTPVDGQINRMGGSHAQWELFEETLVVCHLRLGQYDDAERVLRRRLAHRASPRDLYWLGRAETGRGAAGGTETLRAASHAWAGAERDNPEQRGWPGA